MHPLSPKQQTWFAKYWPALLIGSAWLWLFWPMMTGQTVCGFRDSAYLYYPLFKWIDTQWAAGDIPLWNPYDQFGVPVVADGSSSVLLSGQVDFFVAFLVLRIALWDLPGDSRADCGRQLLLFCPTAGLQTRRRSICGDQLRVWRERVVPGLNVIYLVGAARLLAVAGVFVVDVSPKNDCSGPLPADSVGALIVLGGDPQLVYNIGLIGVGTIAGKAWRARRIGHRHGDFRFLLPVKAAVGPTGRLLVLVVVTAVLSAIQILPLLDWTKKVTGQNLVFRETSMSWPNRCRSRGRKDVGHRSIRFYIGCRDHTTMLVKSINSANRLGRWPSWWFRTSVANRFQQTLVGRTHYPARIECGCRRCTAGFWQLCLPCSRAGCGENGVAKSG